MNKQQAFSLLLYSAAISMVMAYVLGLFSADATGFLTGDSLSYLELATRGGTDPYRTFLYPALLAMLKSYFPSTYFLQAVFFTQFALWILTAWMSMLILRRYVSTLMVLLISATWILNPSYLVYTHLVLTETLFNFLLISSLFFVLKNETKRDYDDYISYFLFCLLPQVRPGFLPFLILFSIYHAVRLIRKWEWIPLIVFTILFCTTIVYPVMRFKETYHRYNLSFIGDLTIYRYLNSQTLALVHQTTIGQEMAANDRISAGHLDQPVWQQAAWQRASAGKTFRQYPVQSLQAYGLSLFSNSHSGNHYLQDIRANAKSTDERIFNLSRAINLCYSLLLMIITLVVLLLWVSGHRIQKHTDFLHVLFLLAVCCFLFFSSGISFWQGDRFHVPWMPVCGIVLGILCHIGLGPKIAAFNK